MNLVLEMPLQYIRPPQPEPKVRGLFKRVKVYYTVTDYDIDRPLADLTVHESLTVGVQDGTLVVGSDYFAPDAWRIYTVEDVYDSGREASVFESDSLAQEGGRRKAEGSDESAPSGGRPGKHRLRSESDS